MVKKMENQVIICDLSVFSGRFKYLKNAMLLLQILVNCRQANNCLNISRQDMIEALSDGSEPAYTDKSVKGWLTLLAKNDAIKFRSNKKLQLYHLMLNPNYVFEGTTEDYANALKNWQLFKSEVDCVA